MASGASKMAVLSVLAPALVGSASYAAWRINWESALRSFLTGPGRNSRIALLLFVLFNWKTMPLAWTYRVLYTIYYHTVLRKPPPLTPAALFKPVVSRTHAPLLEIDYNLHKSNSTYFADLDVSRSHLITYLITPAVHKVRDNARARLVLDPATGEPLRGKNLTVALGAVACSFKREIAAYRGYEMWSRVLAWDRKWVYVITHFVPPGAARPTEWLDHRSSKDRVRGPADAAGGWDKKMYAAALSKYVFKVGRLTVHPAVILGASGLLPERPGGWVGGGERQVGDESADLSGAVDDVWDWRRVEAQRRAGMEMAAHFHELDGLIHDFDGGRQGALGRFGPG